MEEIMIDIAGLKEKLIEDAHNFGLYRIGFASVGRWEEGAVSAPVIPGTPMPAEPRENYFPKNIWPWSKTVISGIVSIPLSVIETTPSNFYSELYNTTNRLLDDAAYRLTALLISLGYKAHFFPRDGYGEIGASFFPP